MTQRLRAAALVLALTIATASAGGASSIDQRIAEKQAKIHEAHLKLQREREALSKAQFKVASLQQELDDTNRNIARVNANLDTIERQVHWNQRRLAWNQGQFNAAKASLQLHTDALRQRLVDAYERGDISYLNLLLAATSFSDFVERWEDIRLLIEGSQRTVRERRDAELKVAAVQRDLESARAQLDASLASQRQAEFTLDGLAGQRRNLLAVADGQRQAVSQAVTELQGLSAAEESALEALIVQRQREEEARREAQRRAAGLAGDSPAGGSSGPLGWPVSGAITSPFGYRADPYGAKASDFHPGIDIGAAMGSTITAAADGVVIFAGWYGGYGNAVIIDHGGGTSTLYGHCSQIFVTEHQQVQRGQAIAAVGSTGHSTGPHLHFEVRVNGSPVDPLSQLR